MDGSIQGRNWLRELPRRVEACRAKWRLRLDAPYEESYVSIVFPATGEDASRVVLKIQFAHDESEHEHEALRLWHGNGAVRLLDYDAEHHALLLDRAIEALEQLRTTQGEQVLIHQDLHADNVLSARREPWLAIDPKPLVGEREFSLAPIIRGAELGFSREHVVRRLDALTARLGLDRERARLWALGQTVAWCEREYTGQHVATARWLAEA